MQNRLLGAIVLLCSAAGAHAAAQHLLLKEVVVAPSPAEYVAIFNPGAAAVDLTNYYIADYETYYLVVNASSAPSAADFIARFPSGAIIAPGETQYVSIGGAECFRSACATIGAFTGYGVYPNYEILSATAANNSVLVPDMLAPFSNAIGSTHNLTNGGEPVTLLYWDGSSNLVVDVDYVYYGTPSVGSPAVNKTGVMVNGSSYLPDTSDSAATHAALSVGITTFTCRRDFAQTGQTASGGNGVAGADETSEPTATTWGVCRYPIAPDRIFADDFEG